MDKKVLIVDDDKKLRELLTEYLTEFGFQVFTLSDGRGILSAIKTENPDIIILDIMLPYKDGFEILREIRTTLFRSGDHAYGQRRGYGPYCGAGARRR